MAKYCKNPYCIDGYVYPNGKKKKCPKCNGTGERK